MRTLRSSILVVGACLFASAAMPLIPASAQDGEAAQQTPTAVRVDSTLRAKAGIACRIFYRRIETGHALVIKATAQEAVEGRAEVTAWAMTDTDRLRIMTPRDLSMNQGDAVEIVMFRTDGAPYADIFGKITVNGWSRTCL